MADLSGTWLGTYWQQNIPTRFEVTLIQSGNTLTGRILDDSYLGEAKLTGEVIGRRISFTKSYFTTSADLINYIGTLSEKEDFMQGQWNIARWDSGPLGSSTQWGSFDGDLATVRAKQLSLTGK
jgi:hypothetical protein